MYWIPRGRESVKRALGECVTCRKHEGKPFVTSKIGPLPSSRVSDDPPFGSYVCLYTCASTRALHLEFVPNLSVTTFLQSFRRFTARRGLPTKLLSDNAKTFKSSRKLRALQGQLKYSDILQIKELRGILLSRKPWQGGFWNEW